MHLPSRLPTGLAQSGENTLPVLVVLENTLGAITPIHHYLHLPKYDTIVLFYLYTKAKRANLSPEQLRRLRDAATIIKKDFRA